MNETVPLVDDQEDETTKLFSIEVGPRIQQIKYGRGPKIKLVKIN